MIKLYQAFLVFLTILTLTACGFTLYSVDSFPPQLKKLYYQTETPYEPFEINLKKRLKACGIKLLSEPDKSSPILTISANYSTTKSSNASSTQARIYTLNYNATISIKDHNNHTLLPPTSVSVSRSLTLQADEVFESTSQVPIAKQEILQELSTKVLNVLSAKRTAEALQKIK